MEELIDWLSQQAIALAALGISIFTLIRFLRFQRNLSSGPKPLPIGSTSEFPIRKQVAPRLEFYPVEDITHAIRNQKLVNRLSLHFKNTGHSLFYDNVEFDRHNKRLEIEILAEDELEIFTDPKEDQKVSHMESLRVTIEREIGEKMVYSFKIFYQDTHGKMYFQKVEGEKGEDPLVSDPIEVES